MLQFVFTILFLIPIIVESKGLWSYENPKQWLRGNRYCGGLLQSPINLQFNISHFDRRLKQMSLEEQNPPEPAELINNGHTVQLHLKNRYLLKDVTPQIGDDFKVEQIHFHWGHSNDNINGSEHLHEGQPYPLEMHMVSYSNLFSNIREAMPNTRSLAVVGVFFELSDEPNPLLQPLVDGLAHVRSQNQQTNVSEEFNLKELIGAQHMGRYYRYDGSLTTPPCYESVIWSILLDPLKLSFTQLHAFRYLHDDKAHLLQNTYRPIQRLGTRKLFRSFISKDIDVDIEQRMLMAENNGQYLTNNIRLVLILTSLLMIVL